MDSLLNDIDNSIKKGVSFLEERQFHGGGFPCLFSNNDRLLPADGTGNWNYVDSCLFPTMLIGSSLLFLTEYATVNKILTKITDFLLAQRKAGSVWNHFTKGHRLYSVCPFDVDDTACASALLKARGIPFPSNHDLLLSHKNKGQLFFTFFTLRFWRNANSAYWRIALTELKHPVKSFFFWRKTEASRNDVDAAVNANVLYYLGATGDASEVVPYLLKIIESKKEADCDTWYRNPFTVYYFISRNYYRGISQLEPARQPIIDRILSSQKPDGCIGATVLDTALAVCSLLNLNYKGSEIAFAVPFLLEQQYKNGGWEARMFYTGGPKMLAGWGGEELTTGICLEAISRYKTMTL